jgi:hypothetical protein
MADSRDISPAPAIVPQADNSEPAPSNINKLRNPALLQRVLIIPNLQARCFTKFNRWMRGKVPPPDSDRRPLHPHQIAQAPGAHPAIRRGREGARCTPGFSPSPERFRRWGRRKRAARLGRRLRRFVPGLAHPIAHPVVVHCVPSVR